MRAKFFLHALSGKTQSILILRTITKIGLKEAKDSIEKGFSANLVTGNIICQKIVSDEWQRGSVAFYRVSYNDPSVNVGYDIPSSCRLCSEEQSSNTKVENADRESPTAIVDALGTLNSAFTNIFATFASMRDQIRSSDSKIETLLEHMAFAQDKLASHNERLVQLEDTEALNNLSISKEDMNF